MNCISRKLLRVSLLLALMPAGISLAQHATDPAGMPELPPGVIAIPQGVRDNLGITFANVERRVVQSTVRMPGRFEATPQSKVEYRSGARGRVTLLVQQYQRVEQGDLLYRIDSSTWRELQARLSQAELAARLLEPQAASARRAVEAATKGVEVWSARVKKLEELQKAGAAQAAQVADASSSLADAEGALAGALAVQQGLELERLTLRDDDGNNPRFEIALREAATLLGTEEGWMLEEVDGKPRWQTLRSIEVRARRAGVIQTLGTSDGSLVDDGDLIVASLDPTAVWFRGFALQADLVLLEEGASVQIVPPHGGIASYTESIKATLQLGIEADPEERTIDLLAKPEAGELPMWARPGVAAFVEVVMSGSHEAEFAIPLSAVATDGVDRVFFLRDREDPDRVRRVVADLGADDGRWIIVHSGVRPGDSVVLNGVYELKLTGSGKVAQGGHFHGDGTFHAGEH